MRDQQHADARSVVSLEDDERSICTSATTASLASRMQSLAVDFGPKHRISTFEHYAEDDEEEDVISVTEEELLKELERQEPAFQVCSRLFRQPFPASVSLRHLDLDKAEAFRANGYTVVDNFISRDYAARLKAEAMLLNRQGQMRYASELFRERSTDDTARGDKIAWLHPESAAADSIFTPLFASIKDIQEDLAKLMNLSKSKTEVQLGYYPPNGAQYVRHRDAFPDDGNELDQRRVTAILYLNPGWKREDGGKLRLWLPQAEPPAESSGQQDGNSGTNSAQPSSPVLRQSSANSGALNSAAASSVFNRQFSQESHPSADHRDTDNLGLRESLHGQSHASPGQNGHVLNGVSHPLGHSASMQGGQASYRNGPLRAEPYNSSEGNEADSSHRDVDGYGRTNGQAASNGHASLNGHGMSNGHAEPSQNGHARMNGHSFLNGSGYSNGHADFGRQQDSRDQDGESSEGISPGDSASHSMHGTPNGTTHGHIPTVRFTLGEDASNGAQNDTSLTQTLSGVNLNDDSHVQSGQMSLDHPSGGPRVMLSMGSLNESLHVEPTEASSAHDNASIDGSVRQRNDTRAIGAEDVEVGTAAAVDVAPVAGRLVVFLSGAIEHAVLPNFSDRIAITFWMQ